MPQLKRKTDLADFIIVVTCGLAVSFTAMILAAMPLIRALSGSRDYLVYWATGQQLVHHANPYDPMQMGRLEHEAGLTLAGSYYMRNPPWALPLAYPLGFIPERVGALPWSLLLLGILGAAVWMVRRAWGNSNRPEIALLGYCFPPGLIAVVMGQTSIYVLLGLVLFLRLHNRHPYLAGGSLWLCTLKPHLLLLFGLVLLVWIVRNRKYRILIGFAVVLLFSCALTEWIDPAVWGQYLRWTQISGIETEFIPCLGVLVRESINPAKGWLAFLPAVLGCCWAVSFYWARQDHWDWFRDGGILVLLSVLMAPYSWIWDQCLVLPALLHSAQRGTSRRLLGALGILYLLIGAMQFARVPDRSVLYLWPALAWPIWGFLASRRRSHGELADQELRVGSASEI